MRALLILNGDIPSPGLVRSAAAQSHAVLCADGGVRHARRLGLKPRFVVGDMDSLPSGLPRWEGVTWLCDFDEDCSDFEKALRFALASGVGELYVAGALGGRLDHALVNLRLIETFSERLPITLLDRGFAHLAGPGRHAFRSRPGQVFSLVAAGGPARVSARGLRYRLPQGPLAPGSRGLSNVALSGRVSIRVLRGRIWIATA